MEGQSLAVAIVTVVPATIASLAAWRSAKGAQRNTNGQLHEPLKRIELKLDDLTEWQRDHVARWHTHK